MRPRSPKEAALRYDGPTRWEDRIRQGVSTLPVRKKGNFPGRINRARGPRGAEPP